MLMAAQAPAGYYNAANGFSGYQLKTKLKTIITTGHNDQGYGGLWDFYQVSAHRDHYYEDDNSLLDIYSENPDGPDSYAYTSTDDQCGNYNGEGDCYNREHLIPQSYFEDYQVNPMKNDALHVMPSDGYVNGIRSNLPFGVVGSANYTSDNGSKRGNNLNSGYSAGYSGVVFEPIDEFKGDIARCFFYFATRYEDWMDNFYTAANGTTTQSKAMFDGTTNKVFSTTFLNILYTWHEADPVSEREIALNNAAYTYQGNRNPYIDHPEWVALAWEAVLGTDRPALADDFAVFPNPTTTHSVSIRSAITPDSVEIIDATGRSIRTERFEAEQGTEIIIGDIPTGFYFLKAVSGQDAVIRKIVVK